ncbi:hypothetical protein HAX54_037550, partial [Datura stramonium]|nr:hypothetical protein [Datura stramonium]
MGEDDSAVLEGLNNTRYPEVPRGRGVVVTSVAMEKFSLEFIDNHFLIDLPLIG